MKYLHTAVFSLLILIICGGYICSSFIMASIDKHRTDFKSIDGAIAALSGYQKLPDIFSYNQVEQLFTPPAILEELKADYQVNNDLAGHISIPNTISLNVMQSVHDPNFYLTHSYDKSIKRYGAPYIDSRCLLYPPCDNIIVYGHNMNNETMFSSLIKYKDKDFYEKNRIISFSTLYERSSYEICSVFTQEISHTSNTIEPHSFYNTINISSYNEFQAFIEGITQNKLYDTACQPRFGDSFLTLVTCTNSQLNSDERFVIVAVKNAIDAN